MGRLAVYKFAYFLSILFTIFILGLSIFAYFSGKINPVENMFAAYVALSKPILVVVNTILFIYWLIRLRYWLWIPLTGLIVNYEYITSMYQIYNPTKYANENRLKVVTYNVHSFGNEITGFSAKEFAEMMNKEETDVLCFQEYRGNGDFTEQDLQNTYAKIFPYSFIPEGLSQAIYSRYPIRQSQTIEFPNTNNGAIWCRGISVMRREFCQFETPHGDLFAEQGPHGDLQRKVSAGEERVALVGQQRIVHGQPQREGEPQTLHRQVHSERPGCVADSLAPDEILNGRDVEQGGDQHQDEEDDEQRPERIFQYLFQHLQSD